MEKSIFESDHFNIFVILSMIWVRKRNFFLIITSFIVMGLFIAFSSPILYTTRIVFIPHTSQSSPSLGGLSGLASLAGVNVNGSNSGDGISPSLYPKVIESVPFQKKILYTPLSFSSIEREISYYTYYKEVHQNSFLEKVRGYTIGLPSLILSSFSSHQDKEILPIQNDTAKYESIELFELELSQSLVNSIDVSVNVRDGFISIFSTMPDPLASADLAEKVRDLLEDYIIMFKSQKSRENLEFIKSQFEEVKKKYLLSQETLARYKDQNSGLSTALANAELQRLQSENDLSFNIYAELAKQLEQAKIQVEEDTPVFTIIQPTSVPNSRSSPNRKFTVFTWAFLGFFFGIIGVFVPQLYSFLKTRFSER